MQQELWKRIDEILPRALELEAEERAAYLDRSCEGDLTLRQELESLLATDTEWLERVERPVFTFFGPSANDDPEGRRIGPYKLVRELGQGGTATVYLAERAEGGNGRQVAVKLLRPGLAGGIALARFGAEGEILARLRHPYIAGIYGGGTTEDHRPYLVMEYVEGEPLDRYCDERRWTTRERLDLFQKICAAVQYAHQNLVVHRDLKPTNILVKPDGTPKLLDFGIAKLLNPETLRPVTVTAPGLSLLTPQYASPEQIRRLPVTTASDVYSLGMVLYELLTGKRPYSLEWHDESDLRRWINEVEPPRPSSIVRHLRGDLDNIVMKALQKEQERRYSSVEALVRDLENYFEGRPVTARRATVAYRVGKLLRRRRREVIAASLSLLVLSGFLLDRERQQRQIARENERARAVSDFMIGILEEAGPGLARGPEVTVREALDLARTRLARLDDQPELQADLMTAVGVMYRNLAVYDSAEDLLTRALELRRLPHGGAGTALVESLNALGILRLDQGEHQAAEPLLAEALAMGRELPADNTALVADSLNGLATVLNRQGDYHQAEEMFREALDLRLQVHGGDHPDVATALDNLAELLQNRGDSAAAEPLFRDALAMRRRLFGETHMDVAVSLNNLANFLLNRGSYDEAELFLHEALGTMRNLLGESHPSVAIVLDNLAATLKRQGDYETAEELYREALDMKRDLLGEDHFQVALTVINLGALFAEQGRDGDAELLYREGYEIQRRVLGEDHPSTARTLSALARILTERGEAEEAEPMARRVVEALRRSYPEEDPRVAQAEMVLGAALTHLGRFPEAEELLLESHRVLREQRGEGDFLTMATRLWLFRHYTKRGLLGKAEEFRPASP